MGEQLMKDRYYVQILTTQVFLVRECVSINGEPARGDRLVKAFDIRHDADLYANEVNEKQRMLDEQYGRWTQQAAQQPI